jgi:hypothetical protein
MSFLCVDVVAVVDDALLLENKEETNVFPVCLAEEESFNAFAVALLCICLRVRVLSGLVRKCDVDVKNASNSTCGRKKSLKNTCVITVDPERYTHIYKEWGRSYLERRRGRRGKRRKRLPNGRERRWSV